MSVKKIGKAQPICTKSGFDEEDEKNFNITWAILDGEKGMVFTSEKLKFNDMPEVVELNEPDYPTPERRFTQRYPSKRSYNRYDGSYEKATKEWEKAYEAYKKSDAYKEDQEKEKKAIAEYNEKKKIYDKQYVEITTKIYERIKGEAFSKPIPLRQDKGDFEKNSNLIYCVYKDIIYKFDRVGYTEEQMLLQIMDLEDGERKKFERLKHKFTVAEQEEKKGKRPAIPEEVRIAVWRRDEGKCVKCGSKEKLEYDHIIPIAKGGSNTVRNIELLCEKCNREKRDNIG